MNRDLRRGILLVCLSVGLTGASYGAVAVSSGFPVWLPVLTATLVLAGSSEFLFVGIVAGGGNPFAAVAAGLLVNARHLPYGLALPDVLGRGWRRAIGTHVMNDESVVLALAQPDRDRQRGAYWISGLGILVSWPLGALLGSVGATFVHDTSKLGLDAMFPAVILALVLPALRERVTLGAGLAGAAVALATVPFAPSGLPELVALVGVLVVVVKEPAGAGAEVEADAPDDAAKADADGDAAAKAAAGTRAESEAAPGPADPASTSVPATASVASRSEATSAGSRSEATSAAPPATSTPDSTRPRPSQESTLR